MKKFNKQNGRKNMRLLGYDYSRAGLYFLTPVIQNRAHLFGYIENGEMILNDAGRMVETEWLKIPERFSNVVLYEYVVMPNHFHCIIEIVEPVGATVGVDPTMETHIGRPQGHAPTSKTVGNIIGAFQSIATVEYIRGVKQYGWQRFDRKLWQRNFYDHIIRNEMSYLTISEYIINNPAKWNDDKFYNE
jgi:REP element-mobilizing transposase RayT